jgi:trimethylamine corrinoid protein
MEDLRLSISTWNADLAVKSVNVALSSGILPAEIIQDGLGIGMADIGHRFDIGKLYLPQVVAASKAMSAALDILRPYMEKGKTVTKGCIVMGSVQGDIHEIGKNVCCAMLRGAGYDVVDLGSDVPPEEFLEAAKKNGAELIGVSALMTTTLVVQKDLIRLLREEEAPFKTAIGGAPCSQAWCDEIGAGGYSASAAEIVGLVDRLLADR